MPEAKYIALKRLKVQELDESGEPRIGEDGRPVIRECDPGDPVPEAVFWKNLWKEVRCGRVGLEGTSLTGPSLADSMRRRAADSTRPRRKSVRRAPKPAPKVEPEPEPDPEPDVKPEVTDVAPAAVESDEPQE